LNHLSAIRDELLVHRNAPDFHQVILGIFRNHLAIKTQERDLVIEETIKWLTELSSLLQKPTINISDHFNNFLNDGETRNELNYLLEKNEMEEKVRNVCDILLKQRYPGRIVKDEKKKKHYEFGYRHIFNSSSKGNNEDTLRKVCDGVEFIFEKIEENNFEKIEENKPKPNYEDIFKNITDFEGYSSSEEDYYQTDPIAQDREQGKEKSVDSEEEEEEEDDDDEMKIMKMEMEKMMDKK